MTGESKLTDYRSNLSRERALALDRRIATFLGVDPSETEDRVRLTVDLSREMSLERLLESLLTFLRRVNGGMLGGVATYTICADDGRPADEAQIEQALYTAAVQHRFLSEVADASDVVLAARNYVQQAGAFASRSMRPRITT